MVTHYELKMLLLVVCMMHDDILKKLQKLRGRICKLHWCS